MKYLSAPDINWRHPDDDPPPKATKVLILSPYGILSVGTWYQGAAAWAPLLKVPQTLRDRLRRDGRLK